MAQDLLMELESEELEIRNHQQAKPRHLTIEVMQEMTTTQIKDAQEFFKIQEDHELADHNLTKVLQMLRKNGAYITQ